VKINDCYGYSASPEMSTKYLHEVKKQDPCNFVAQHHKHYFNSKIFVHMQCIGLVSS